MKRVLSAFAVFLFLFLGANNVSAINGASSNVNSNNNVNNNNSGAKNANAVAKCNQIESRISTKITRYEDGKIRRLSAYNNLKNKIREVYNVMINNRQNDA